MASSTELIEAFSRGVVKALLEAGASPRTKLRKKTTRKRVADTAWDQQELPLASADVARVIPVVQPEQTSMQPPTPEELDAIIRGMTPEYIEAALSGNLTPGMRMPGEGEYVSD